MVVSANGIDWAAWVQAIGSLVAVGLSILFWRGDVRARKQSQAASSAALAVSIERDVEEVHFYLDSLIERLPDPKFGSYRGSNYRLSDFDVPQSLLEASKRAGELGYMGVTLLSLVRGLAVLKPLGDEIERNRGGVQNKVPPVELLDRLKLELLSAQTDAASLKSSILAHIKILAKHYAKGPVA